MRKIVTVYVAVGCIFGDSVGSPTQAEAEQSARSMSGLGWYPNGFTVEAREFELPDDAFWTGDIIAVELHRGGRCSDPDESILSGGSWIGPVQGRVCVTSIDLEGKRVYGLIVDPMTERFIQALPLRAGVVGFPYRNAVLVVEG